MPMDRERYPSDWAQIAADYKDSIGWCCEECGIPHMGDGKMSSCLTVHHPNHDPENPDAVLKGLCATCHLADERKWIYDQKHKDQLKLYPSQKGGDK